MNRKCTRINFFVGVDDHGAQPVARALHAVKRGSTSESIRKATD